MNLKVWAGLLILALVGVGAAAVGQKPTAPAAVLAPAEAEKWAGRIRRLVPAGWDVTARGDSIVIARHRPVRFRGLVMNAPSAEATVNGPLHEGPYRLTFRFARKLSLDEYEALRAINVASGEEWYRLRNAVGVRHKFDQFSPATPAEEARVRAFHEAVGKLPRHDLPHLYTPDLSIRVAQSWAQDETIVDAAERRECTAVLDAILKYFGMYDVDFLAA